MSSVIINKVYSEPPLCEREILRYAGCREADAAIAALLAECLEEAKDKLAYKVCYRELPLALEGDVCDLGSLRVRSADLAKSLRECERVILFAATVGVGIDRLIARYTRLSPARALLLGAFGAERIEALCDAFCADVEREYGCLARPRFSPGYGDLPLEAQKDIFRLLDCERQIGLTLGDSLLMSPTKSVTALVGLGGRDMGGSL